jgi:hypothetical protein
MCRFVVVFAWAALFALANVSAHGAIYYADSRNGDDSLDGLSAATAWRSLAKVNAAPLKPGDAMLFRRGSVWRGLLDSKSGEPDMPVRYGAYGEGPKPLFLGSENLSLPGDWLDEGHGVWKTRKPIAEDVGIFICDHGRRWGVKKWTRDDLSGELDYWHDEESRHVFVKLPKSPAEMFHSIELAKKGTVISHSRRHDVIWDSLAVMYSGGFAFSGGQAFRLVVRNCDMGWIGGSLQKWKENDGKRVPVRYGNAVEYWSPSWSNVVERCRVWQVYDAAFTPQTSRSRHPIHHIVFRDNVIWQCEYSFEYWNHDPKSYTADIVFERNTCVDAGDVWSHAQRPNPNGAHVMSYRNDAPCTNIIFRDNIFCRTTDRVVRVFTDWRSGAVFDHNLYWVPENTIYRYEGADLPYRVRRTNETERVFGAGAEEFVRYQKTMKMDVSSAYGEPQFMNAASRDYRLRPGTPGTNLATDGGPVGARGMPGLDGDQSIR